MSVCRFRLVCVVDIVCRSSSVYRSFFALVALIRFSHSRSFSSLFLGVYPSFAADGCIFHLETLARSLGDSCAEKEYLLALVDIGRAALIIVAWSVQRYDSTNLRTELLDAISLQQYVPFPPTQSYLIFFLQSAQPHLNCFRWQSVHCPCKSLRFSPLAASILFLLHH